MSQERRETMQAIVCTTCLFLTLILTNLAIAHM